MLLFWRRVFLPGRESSGSVSPGRSLLALCSSVMDPQTHWESIDFFFQQALFCTEKQKSSSFSPPQLFSLIMSSGDFTSPTTGNRSLCFSCIRDFYIYRETKYIKKTGSIVPHLIFIFRSFISSLIIQLILCTLFTFLCKINVVRWQEKHATLCPTVLL